MGKQPVSELDGRIGQRIKLARKLNGFSQTKLSKHLDITFQQVQKYEKGLNRVSASKLMKIASVTGYPISWFYEVSEHPSPDIETEWLTVAMALSKIEDPTIQKNLAGLIYANSPRNN